MIIVHKFKQKCLIITLAKNVNTSITASLVQKGQIKCALTQRDEHWPYLFLCIFGVLQISLFYFFFLEIFDTTTLRSELSKHRACVYNYFIQCSSCSAFIDISNISQILKYLCQTLGKYRYESHVHARVHLNSP